MTASTRRVRYIGRNHDTPDYRPTPIREDIAPMHGSEFQGPGAVPAMLIALPVGVLLWAAFFGAIFS